MVTITYVEHDGTKHTIAAEEGKSLMLNAVDNMVPGIDADCGGACACGTCHIFVAEDWLAKTGEPDRMEECMLQMHDGVASNSRLSCQIDVHNELDGLVVHMPESQY